MIIEVGTYRTVEGRDVRICRVENGRAFGYAIDAPTNTTWWYADTGEHGIYTPDDLIIDAQTAANRRRG